MEIYIIFFRLFIISESPIHQERDFRDLLFVTYLITFSIFSFQPFFSALEYIYLFPPFFIDIWPV